MFNKFLVDTDVLVDFLRGRKKAVNYIKKHLERIVISAISVAELYAGVKGDEECKELDDFIELLPILPVTREIARMGGFYKRDFFKSHNLGIADAIIAATADAYKMELKTLNIKHFPMFKGLKPPYRKK